MVQRVQQVDHGLHTYPLQTVSTLYSSICGPESMFSNAKHYTGQFDSRLPAIQTRGKPGRSGIIAQSLRITIPSTPRNAAGFEDDTNHFTEIVLQDIITRFCA